jgi:hypothetical protein
MAACDLAPIRCDEGLIQIGILDPGSPAEDDFEPLNERLASPGRLFGDFAGRS